MSAEITIFTPTYNRAHLLPRLYHSLERQTSRSFVWRIVDDGSTDCTAQLVQEWQATADFSIEYEHLGRAGKQSAHNLAVQASDTELFLCVDSDDYLVDDAVAVLLSAWREIDDKSLIAGIVALRGSSSETPLGSAMPDGIKNSTISGLYERHGFRGDSVLLFRVDVLREYPFPVAEGETFIGESSAYNRLDRDYTMYLMNRIVYIGEYQEGGYSSRVRELVRQNPKGYALLNYEAYLAASTLKGRLSATVKYLVGVQLAGRGAGVTTAPNKALAVLLLPAATCVRILFYR